MVVRVLAAVVVLAGCGLGSSPRWQPDAAPGACGDGLLAADEACDDGNTTSGDGCNAGCTSDESCGNGMSDVAELCDDGNTVGGDDCSSDCQSDETCGNGVLDIARGESCDDANSVSSDGCANNCQSNESCGNMVLDSATGESCDPGNNVPTSTCDPDCSRASCGDGYRNIPAGEQCDTSGSTTTCDADCTLPVCGDSVFNAAVGEQCDSGSNNGNGQTTCRTNCRVNVCGDSYRHVPSEACDTGGNSGSCDADCTTPVCGDGYANGAAGEACDDGVNDIHGSCPACRALSSSCRAVLAAFPSATSGVYTLAGASGPYRAFCEMSAAGGGWTLAVKADGSRSTFSYDQPIWETPTLLSTATPDFDRIEAKLDSWNSVPFSELRVGLEYPIGSGTVTWIIVPLGAARLGDLFAAGVQATTNVGRNAWKSLIPGASSLQPNCNAEGTNLYHAYSRVRLGIVANNEADCGTPDSRLGIGGGGEVCSSPTQSAGNSSCYGGDNGDVELAAFGWIMVR